jgi:hypothetical protein
MTVIYSVNANLTHAGALPRLVASSHVSKGINERLGAARMRLWTLSLGGPQALSVTWTMEFPNARAAFAFGQAYDTDPDAQAFHQATGDLSGAMQITSIDLLSEIPSMHAAETATPSVGVVAVANVRPGAALAAQEQNARMEPLVRKLGAVSVRAFSILIGGPATGSLVSFTEFADAAGAGEFFDALSTPSPDAAAQDLLTIVGAPDSPILGYSLSILQEIPF